VAVLSRRHLVMGLGWLVAISASALPALWAVSRAIDRDYRGRLVDPESGEFTERLYQLFAMWWLPVLIPVLLLGCACLFVDWRPRDGRRDGRRD